MELLPLDIRECKDVYPPSEDSDLLVESLDVHPGERILEVGCGSGYVSIHCAKHGAEVTSVDINPLAVDCTIANAKMNEVHLTVKVSDVYGDVDGRFDNIVFNLPYLPVEEDGLLEKAWSGGTDGLGPLPRLLEGASVHLNECGRIVIVTSSLMDTDALERLLSEYDVRTLGELSLFFERLKVLEIRPRTY